MSYSRGHSAGQGTGVLAFIQICHTAGDTVQDRVQESSPSYKYVIQLRTQCRTGYRSSRLHTNMPYSRGHSAGQDTGVLAFIQICHTAGDTVPDRVQESSPSYKYVIQQGTQCRTGYRSPRLHTNMSYRRDKKGRKDTGILASKDYFLQDRTTCTTERFYPNYLSVCRGETPDHPGTGS
jgi:hypothetical protein